jgi:hypothetical protein
VRLKACDFIRSFSNVSEEISRGWIDRWKIRHQICSRKMAGESADVPEASEEGCKSVHLPSILRRYQPSNILTVTRLVRDEIMQ